jgi:hypothetical protein
MRGGEESESCLRQLVDPDCGVECLNGNAAVARWLGEGRRGRGRGRAAGPGCRGGGRAAARQGTRNTEHDSDSEGVARPGEPAAGVALADACGEETADGQERCAAGMTGRRVLASQARVIAR